jgi:hypothetical protein
MRAGKLQPRKKEREQELLDEALEETFPASDTPALVAPGGGITSPHERKEQPADLRKRAPSAEPKRK